jgi:hypothetical protein
MPRVQFVINHRDFGADYAIRQRLSLRDHAYYLKTDPLWFLRWRSADKSLLRALARSQPLRAIFATAKKAPEPAAMGHDRSEAGSR